MTPGIFLVTGIFLIPCEHRVKNPGMPSTCRHLLGCREQRELRTGAGLAVTHLGTCTEPRPAPGRVCPTARGGHCSCLGIARLQGSHTVCVTALLGRKCPSLLQRKEKGLSGC